MFQQLKRDLARNKLRTTLTLLGIAAACALIICTWSIGEGGSSVVREQLSELGTNLIWIQAGDQPARGIHEGFDTARTLTLDDMSDLAQAVPALTVMAPVVDGSTQVVYSNRNWCTTYRGTSREYFEIRRWQLDSGDYFAQQDVERAGNVCLLGRTVADALFQGSDPIGKTIRIGALPAQVVGVLKSKGLAVSGRDQDDYVMLPYTTALHKLRGGRWLDAILGSTNSRDALRPAKLGIAEILRQRHQLLPTQPDDFAIMYPEATWQAREAASRSLTLMLVCIASIALIVGGVGIMNIMLSSVMERTREIGIRLTAGARQQDVQFQLLAEAAALALLGGIAGVAVGVGAATGIARLLLWPTVLSPIQVLTAIFFACAVGILFGYYPARKAARLDPIEAIRYE